MAKKSDVNAFGRERWHARPGEQQECTKWRMIDWEHVDVQAFQELATEILAANHEGRAS